MFNAKSPSPQPSPRRKEGSRLEVRAQIGKGPLAGQPVGQTARLVVACGAVPQHFAGRLEAKFGNHPRRGRVLLEMADGEIVEALLGKGVEDQRPRRLGSVAKACLLYTSPSPRDRS